MRYFHETLIAAGPSSEIQVDRPGEVVYVLIAETSTAIDVQPQIFIDDLWVDHGTALTVPGSGNLRAPVGARMRLNVTGTAVTSAEIAMHG